MSGPRRHVGRVSLLLVALTCPLAACGSTDGREADVSAAATSFERALRGGDPTAVCAALAPQTRRETEESERKPCADAVAGLNLPAGEPLDGVDVYGRQARAVLASDTLFLSQFPDGWKIVAAGCRPRSGQPYQCAVKGG